LVGFVFRAPVLGAPTDRIGKNYYLRANLWHDEQGLILSTNYREDRTFLPAGTEVMITRLTDETIEFTIPGENRLYTILDVRHHSMRVSVETLFDWYFSADNPAQSPGPFDTFTETEKKNILAGTIERGMSRQAVLMAYGYPPRYLNSSLTNDFWVYWDSPRSSTVVQFVDDRVFRIARDQDGISSAYRMAARQ